MFHHSLIPASYLFLRKGNLLLFSRRFQTGYEDGKWSLPAGHVEESETFTQCMIREAKEEIGVDISEKDLCVAHVLQRDSRTPSKNNRIDLFYVADTWQGIPKIMEPEKCDGLEWFDKNNLPDTVLP